MRGTLEHARFLCDDDRAVRDSLRRSLEFNGYTVDLASDGAEALARARRSTPTRSSWTS